MFKAIARNLIPENFRENALINDVINIFVDYIWEYSDIAIDIANLYNSKNPVLYEEIVKIYAANFFKTITDGTKNNKLNNAVRKAHEKWGFKFNDVKLNLSAIDLLSREQLELFKQFQQSKGTIQSIEFIYRIIEQLNIESFALESAGDLKIYPGKNIFEYVVEGSMLPEIFEAFVKPLAHPVGWVCIYLRLYALKFDDYFTSKEVYDVKIFRVKCENSEKEDNFKTNKGYLFETDEKGQAIIENGEPKCYKAEGKVVNNITRFGEKYKNLTLRSELILVENPEIRTITKTSIKGNNKITIYFESGEYLEQNSKPRSLILYYGSGINDLNQKIKKDYTRFLENCALELSYERTVVTRIKDKLVTVIDSGFANTTGKIAAVGAGNLFVGARGFKLGDRLVNQHTPITWNTFASNKILRSTSYKSLVKTKDNKERRVFSRVRAAPLYHINVEKVELFKKEGDYYYIDIISNRKYFLECLDLKFRKVNVKTVITDEGFRVYSKNQFLYIIHWEDKLQKIIRTPVLPESFTESEEPEDIKLGKYFIETDKPPLSLYANNNLVSFNLKFSENKWYIFTDTNEPNMVLLVDEEPYKNSKELLQLKLLPITFNQENKYKVELPLSNSYILRFYNKDSDLNIQTSYDIKYDDWDSDILFDRVTLSIEPPEDNSEVTCEVQYILNIKEMKTLVYFENYMVNLDELPIAITLNEEAYYINTEEDLKRESDILKIYFNLDIRNQRARLQAVDKSMNLLELKVFDFNPRYKTLKSNFDSRLMKFTFNNVTNYHEHTLPPKHYYLAVFNRADDEVKVQVRLVEQETQHQIIEIETDKSLRLFYLDDTEDQYQIEIVNVEDYDFSECYILYYFKNNILDYYSGDKALIIKNKSIIETKEFSTIAESVKAANVDFENLDEYSEEPKKLKTQYIKIPDNKFPLRIKKDNETIELQKITQIKNSEFRTKLATKVDNRYVIDLLKDTGENYKLVFDKQVQKVNHILEEDLHNLQFERDYMNVVGDFAAHDTTTFSKFTGTSHKKLYKIEQTSEHGFFCIDDFKIDHKVLGSKIDINFNFDDKFGIPREFLKIQYTGFYLRKWGWQSGYVDTYSTRKDLPRFQEKQSIDDTANFYALDDYIYINKNDIRKDYFFKPYPVFYDKMTSFKPINVIKTEFLLNPKTGFYEFNLQPKQYPITFVNDRSEEIAVDYKIGGLQIVIKSRKKIDRRLIILDDRRNDFLIKKSNPEGKIITYLTPENYFTLCETEQSLVITKDELDSQLAQNIFNRMFRDTAPLRQTLDINYLLSAISDSNEIYEKTSDYTYNEDFVKNGSLSPLLRLNEVKAAAHYKNQVELIKPEE